MTLSKKRNPKKENFIIKKNKNSMHSEIIGHVVVKGVKVDIVSHTTINQRVKNKKIKMVNLKEMK